MNLRYSHLFTWRLPTWNCPQDSVFEYLWNWYRSKPHIRAFQLRALHGLWRKGNILLKTGKYQFPDLNYYNNNATMKLSVNNVLVPHISFKEQKLHIYGAEATFNSLTRAEMTNTNLEYDVTFNPSSQSCSITQIFQIGSCTTPLWLKGGRKETSISMPATL